MRQLRREGVALAYEEAGSGAPPIMLVHDLGSDHTCFASQFEHLSRCHRVVAVDLRGHGESDKTEEGCKVDLLADDLAWLCYELGLYRPVLLGHGIGGRVALDLAARYPDLPAAVAVARASLPLTTLSQHPTVPRVRGADSWDEIAATPGCAVPVLRVALATEEGTLAADVNLLIDAFLSKLPGRAPP